MLEWKGFPGPYGRLINRWIFEDCGHRTVDLVKDGETVTICSEPHGEEQMQTFLAWGYVIVQEEVDDGELEARAEVDREQTDSN